MISLGFNTINDFRKLLPVLNLIQVAAFKNRPVLIVYCFPQTDNVLEKIYPNK